MFNLPIHVFYKCKDSSIKFIQIIIIYVEMVKFAKLLQRSLLLSIFLPIFIPNNTVLPFGAYEKVDSIALQTSKQEQVNIKHDLLGLQLRIEVQ